MKWSEVISHWLEVESETIYTREWTYYAGFLGSGEELNTYENEKHMEVKPT